MDHDQLFKELVKECIIEAMELFTPWLEQRRLQPPQWLPEEYFTNPPLGRVLKLDRVFELTLRGTTPNSVVEELLDVEIESATSLTEVRKKIAMYFPVLSHQSSRTVHILAFYLKVPMGLGYDHYVRYEERNPQEQQPQQGSEPSPQEKLREQIGQTGETAGRRILYYVDWRSVGLPGLKVAEYLYGKNILGVVLCALMQIEDDKQAAVKTEILRRIQEECREWNYRTVLLINVVETYLPLEGEQLNAYQRLLQHEPKFKEIPNMLQTYADKLSLQGECKARREMVIELATETCGEPDEHTRTRINALEDLAHLRRLVLAAPKAQSWDQLLAVE